MFHVKITGKIHSILFSVNVRNFKFSTKTICWSTGIKFTLAELYNITKLDEWFCYGEFNAGAPTSFIRWKV